MDEYAEVIERLRDEGGFDDEIAVLEKFEKGSLRKQAARSTELEAEVNDLKAKLEKVEAAPARQKAFSDYGIDFEALRPAERRLLEQYEGELTQEAIADLVEQNELPTVEGESSETGEGETSGAQTIADTAKRAGNNGSRTPRVTPADVASWPADRWARFAEANPDAAEALRQGETVTGVTA